MIAVVYIIKAILILIFLYLVGRIFTAACLMSWIDMKKKLKKEEKKNG